MKKILIVMFLVTLALSFFLPRLFQGNTESKAFSDAVVNHLTKPETAKFMNESYYVAFLSHDGSISRYHSKHYPESGRALNDTFIHNYMLKVSSGDDTSINRNTTYVRVSVSYSPSKYSHSWIAECSLVDLQNCGEIIKSIRIPLPDMTRYGYN